MRVVIEIDEGILEGIVEGGGDIPRNIVRSFQATIADAIKKGTVLPDNLTNGDMIKAMFPNERIGHCEDCTDLGDIATFDDDWWNAPYREDGE